MSAIPVALWGAQIKTGEDAIYPGAELIDYDAVVHITMAAIDPTAKGSGEGPQRATLKMIRRAPSLSSMYDSDEEDEDSESDDEPPKKSKKAEKSKSKAKAEDGSSDSEGNDSDLENESDDEGSEIEEFVLCTLDTDRNYQQPLNLTIRGDEQIFFVVSGTHDISLTGNYVIHHDHDHDHDGDSDYDSDGEDYDFLAENDSEDELDELENPRIQEITDEELANKNGNKSLKRGAEAEETKKSKKAKSNDGNAIPVETTPSVKKEDKRVKFAKELEQGPSPSKDQKAGKVESKKDKKNKKDAQAEEKKDKNGVKAEEKKEKKDAKAEKKDAKPEEKKANGPQKVNGVTIDERSAGTGPGAKSGQKLSVRYIGKLNDGKIFDSNTKGKPFTFTLGQGMVIKGWDIGLAGMKVGGERRITVPAELAYGNKKLPGIPAKSQLTFDVKLLQIK